MLITIKRPFKDLKEIIGVLDKPVELLEVKDLKLRKLLRDMLSGDPENRPTAVQVLENLKDIYQKLFKEPLEE